MKLSFIGLLMYDAGATGGGGFTTEEKKELKSAMEDVKKHYEGKILEEVGGLKEAMTENQKAVDLLITRMKEQNGLVIGGKKTFGEALSQGLESKFAEIRELFPDQKRMKSSFRLDLKDVGVMTTAASLTGDPVISYNSRQALIPTSEVNFRDLIPTSKSDTGTYVTYRETAGEGGVDIQSTEGTTKANMDFDFVEDKKVNKYVAGTVKFSKQLMRNLPWLQTTLPRLLLRKFYEKENSYFSGVFAAGATGFATSVETDDAKAIIDILAGRGDANFKNSFALVKYTALARILKLLYTNGYYQGSGSVVGGADGSVRIFNAPIIPVSWVPSADKIMVVDNDYIERVEVESLGIEFAFQNDKDFEENLVTARIECFEELNIMMGAAHTYFDLGNSSSS